MARKTKQNPVSNIPTKAEAKTLKGDGSVETTNRETGATAVAEPPKPRVKKSLRGRSTVSGPVRQVWEISDRMAMQARERNLPLPARKDVVNHCVASGIAPYTARTQYQLWFAHTNRGKSLLADGNLPKRFQEAEAEGDEE